MKNIHCLLFLLIAIAVQAQPARFKEKKEQIRALKTAYISTALSLTTEESVKFWPLYNAFEDKQRDIKLDKWKRYIDNTEGNLDELNTKEATALLTKMEIDEDLMYQNRKKFIQSLKEFLPAIKILKLKKAEDQFNQKLLQQFRNKKEH